MPAEYRLSIITVNFNGLEDTCALIDSIPPTEGMEVIIVDNGSQQDEARILVNRYPHIHAIRSEQNLGFAGGNNLGIKASKGQYLFFINNDTVFLDDWNIDALISRLSHHPKTGIVCPKIRFAWDNHPIQYAGFTPLTSVTLRNHSIGFNEPDNGQYDEARPTPYAHGAAMLVRRDAIAEVGLLPECYFLYYEELDWSMMFRRSGYEIWYDPCTTIYHKESKTTGLNSPLKSYYITRNRLLFVKRNKRGALRFISYAYLIICVGIRDIIKHLFHGRFKHTYSTLLGIRDFLIGRQGQFHNSSNLTQER